MMPGMDFTPGPALEAIHHEATRLADAFDDGFSEPVLHLPRSD